MCLSKLLSLGTKSLGLPSTFEQIVHHTWYTLLLDILQTLPKEVAWSIYPGNASHFHDHASLSLLMGLDSNLEAFQALLKV